MSFGGGHPYPRKMGGGESRPNILRAAIAQDRGDAYSTDPNSVVYLENLALARAISSGWGTNERLGNLWNPYACSPDVLGRWETILALAVSPSDSLGVRRARVAAKMVFFAQGYRGIILQALAPLGAVLLAVEYVDIASAYVVSPDGTYPFGVQDVLTPWSSTVAKIVLRFNLPSGYTEGDFNQAVAQALAIVEPYLPAWVSVDWYRSGPTFSSIGGLSGAGFYADDPLNTNYEILDA